MKGKFRFRNLIIIVLCTIFVCGFIKQQSAMNRIKKETQEKSFDRNLAQKQRIQHVKTCSNHRT